MKARAKTIEEAALQTFTGKMAQRRGFKKVKSISGIQNPDGTYKIVNSLIFEQMIVLVSKNNTEEKKRFLIPRNNTYNCKNWVEITVDNVRKEFTAKKVGSEITRGDEWEEKEIILFHRPYLQNFYEKIMRRQIN